MQGSENFDAEVYQKASFSFLLSLFCIYGTGGAQLFSVEI